MPENTSTSQQGKKPGTDKIKSDIIEKLSVAREFKMPWEKKALEMYALFRNAEDEVNAKQSGHRYKGRSRVKDPEANRIIEVVSSRVARGATIDYEPRKGESGDHAKALSQAAKYYLSKRRFGVQSRLWVKESLITGTGYMKTGWDHQTQSIQRRVPRFQIKNPMDPKKELVRFGTTVKKENKVTIDMPTIDVVDFADMFVSPFATSPLNVPYYIQTFRVNSREELKANPNYDKKAIDKIQGHTENKATETGGEDQKDARYRQIGASLPVDNDGFHGLEFWGKHDIDGEGEKQVVIVIVGDQIIRMEENPFFHQMPPYIPYRPIPVPHQFYGMGVLEASRTMFHALTAIRRQRIDAGTLSLNPMLVVVRSAGVNDNELKSTPGAIWHTEDPNGIIPIKVPEPSQFSYAEIQELKRDVRDATGATEFLSGGGEVAGNRTTAQEFNGRVEQANLKFRQMLDMFEEESLMDFGDMLKSNIQQFMSQPVQIKLMGEKDAKPDLLEARPKDVLGDFDTITQTEASAIGSKQRKFNQVLQGFQLLVNSPFVNQLWLHRKLMEEALDWKDANEGLVNPAQRVDQSKRQQLQIADEENRDPTKARVRPDDDHSVHLDAHDAFIRSEVFEQLSEEEQLLITRHREEHAQLMHREEIAGRGSGDPDLPPPPSVQEQEEGQEIQQREGEQAPVPEQGRGALGLQDEG